MPYLPLLSLLTLFLAGCTSEHSIHYRLDWRRDRVEVAGDGQGWSVVSDLGYRITVAQGYLSSHTTELVECESATPADPGYSWSLIRPAFAGHMIGVHPSAFRVPRIESLLHPVPSTVSRVLPGRRFYCRAHYLIARADPSAKGLPSDADMLGQSLHLRGTFARGDAPGRPFALRTAAANSVVVDLRPSASDAAPIRFDSGAGDATVVVERDLGALFDGLDFAHAPERQWSRRVLQNLIDHTQIHVELAATEPTS